MTDSQAAALDALRVACHRLCVEADAAYEDGRATEVTAFNEPLAGEDLLGRIERKASEFWSWSVSETFDGAPDEFNLRARELRDDARRLRRWIEGRL